MSKSSALVAGFVAGSAAGALVAYWVLTRRQSPNEVNLRSEADRNTVGSVVAELQREFGVSTDDLREVMTSMTRRMWEGLAREDGQLKMIPTYVTHLPTGEETGDFLALDLGGSNFRVLKVTLVPGKTPTISSRKFVVPQQAMTGDAKMLFGFIADCIKQFCPDTVNAKTPLWMGFTFSFPIRQTAINKGKLLQWTKGFNAKGCVGEDVVELLQTELDERSIKVHVAALINDTVGTLMAHALHDPDCVAGLIIGTGTNICYVEKGENVTKLGPAPYTLPISPAGGGDHMVINTEWGAFACDKMKPNRFDRLVDEHSINRGAYLFEKQISGMYLGEITRHVICELVARKVLFRGLAVDMTAFNTQYAFLTASMAAFEADHDPDLMGIQNILQEKYNVLQSSLLDRLLIKNVCTVVSTRAARLAAAGIAAICNKVHQEQRDRRKMTCAVDGSVYKLYPYFKQRMEEALAVICGKYDIELIGADDGSGVGAATVASMMTSHRDPLGRPLPETETAAYPGTLVRQASVR